MHAPTAGDFETEATKAGVLLTELASPVSRSHG